ncbi:unnamed protein product [Clonostachys chloroleuca]|uniref:Prokaryotic phospholipase A2-domain-containing protein n=1 Tax=Clonostachys chloroleuca TaxID=1926264 RepID=A0AA35Q085_9HYPO|nr:unnamed protein product [Clonostachys chloroleuca]
MKLSTVFAFAAGALAMPTSYSSEPLKNNETALVDCYIFNLTLPEFLAKREAKDPPSLNWTSDGCTTAPANPFNFDFTPGCQRHDFGYANYRKQGRFNIRGKKRVDEQLLVDLRNQCKKVSHVWSKLGCEGLAEAYFFFYRSDEFGGGHDATGHVNPGLNAMSLKAVREKKGKGKEAEEKEAKEEEEKEKEKEAKEEEAKEKEEKEKVAKEEKAKEEKAKEKEAKEKEAEEKKAKKKKAKEKKAEERKARKKEVNERWEKSWLRFWVPIIAPLK